MFIIKFNNMIRNKWLWGAFAVIVAGAFIMSDSMLSSSASGDNGYGKLNGKAVDPQEFLTVSRIVELNRNMGRNFASSDCSATKEAWLMLAALRTADELKITVSDEEVAAAIMKDPTFKNKDGQFDKAYAQLIIQNYLKLSLPQYENYIRIMMKLDFLRSYVLSQTPVVPASEIKVGVDAMSDVFTFTPAVLSNTVVATELKLTDDELKAYFETHKETYRKPARVSVRQVSFEASKFLDKSKVTEEEIQSYYDDNYSKYLVKGENGAEDTYKPLEEVKEQIISDIAREASQRAAYDAADIFNNKLIEDNALTMEALAAVDGYTVVTTALFSADAPAPVVMKNSQEYVDAAFNLVDGEDHMNYADAPIFAGSQTFVIAYNSHEQSVIPAFDEVRALVLRDAQIEKAFNTYNEKLSELAKAVDSISASQKTFEDVAKEFNLAVGTNITASVRNIVISGTEEEKLMITSVSKLEKGVVSKPIALPNDTAVILKVIDRTPVSEEEKKSIEPMVRLNLQSEIAPRVWTNWLEENLASMDFQTTMSLEDTAEAAE
ncbi:MAG: SurA N-terminal domain-containing protein [Kiritimatiellae bacterium]|nr:SurA N-terminal domain-containing protein [Kiritimatiellia bacterium]